MNILKYWLSRRFFIGAIFLYLLLMVFVGMMKSDSLPSLPIIGIQLLYLLFVFIASQSFSMISVKRTLLLIFLFQLVCSFGLRYFNIVYFNDPLGYEPADALFYDETGQNCSVPYLQYMATMFATSGSVGIDDIGFPTIIYVVYNIFGSYGREILVLFNAIIVTFSSYLLHKTANLFTENRISLFIAFVWGIEAFAIFTASSGLKENFFGFFIIAALYFLCRLQKRIAVKDLFWFILLCSCVLLFRLALFYALIASFMIICLLKIPFVKNHIWFFAVLSGLLVLANFALIAGQLVEQRGSDYESLYLNQEIKGGGVFEWIVNLIAALIGPFPSFVSDEFKRNYITLYSFTPFVKMLISVFFLRGMLYALVHKQVQYFPLIFLWMFNTFMIVFTFYSLHDRFQWPHIPAVLILSAIGYKDMIRSKHFTLYTRCYIFIVILLIFIFNLR